jgi:hypothetical protein
MKYQKLLRMRKLREEGKLTDSMERRLRPLSPFEPREGSKKNKPLTQEEILFRARLEAIGEPLTK